MRVAGPASWRLMVTPSGSLIRSWAEESGMSGSPQVFFARPAKA